MRQVDLCECQLTAAERAQNRELERQWAAAASRRDADQAAQQRTYDHQADLRNQAEQCKAMMERQFDGCKDKEQAFECCALCPLKRKKRTKGPRKP